MDTSSISEPVTVTGRRKSGSRKLEILQSLAVMLEDPRGEKITTAALASRLSVSEAALYRHFASKAQMFEGLIDFIETSIFSLINSIATQETSGKRQTQQMVRMLLEFAQNNPGMTRVMVGDALLHENDRLLDRMNQFTDRIETSLRQAIRAGIVASDFPAALDASAHASMLVSFVLGRWQRFVRSGFKRMPTEFGDTQPTTWCI
jgi:TetR/AcrR family transcriptional regulator